MQTKHVYKQDLESQLRVSDVQISQLKTKLNNAHKNMTSIYARQLNDIKSNQREITLKLETLNNRHQSAKRPFKKNIEHFSCALLTDMNSAINKFKYKYLGGRRWKGFSLHRLRSPTAEASNDATR